MILSILAFLAAALRIGGITAPWFQALAHLLVGGLYGGALASPRNYTKVYSDKVFYFTLAIALTLVEIYCAYRQLAG